jgi:nitroreductase
LLLDEGKGDVMSNHQEGALSTLDVIFARRSVRAFTSAKLEKSSVRGLLDAAVQAPTAMHEQPWVFAVVQDPHVLRRLNDRVKAVWIREAAAPPELHLTETSSLHGAFIKHLEDPDFDVFYGATTLIVIGVRRLDPFVTADCWLAAENLMLAACALGLGTCCVGAAVPALNTLDGKAAVGLPADVTAIVPIVVGVPSGAVEPVTRREPEILSWK